MKLFWDIDALCKSLIVNLGVTAVWFAFEYKQFGELQGGRECDNVVCFLYILILWWAFHEKDKDKVK